MNPRASDTLVQFIHLPVFLAVALILLFLIALPVEIALEHVYEPSYLLFTLNAIFITAVSFWISWQALRGFLASGLIPMLVLGCALLSAGSAFFISIVNLQLARKIFTRSR